MVGMFEETKRTPDRHAWTTTSLVPTLLTVPMGFGCLVMATLVPVLCGGGT
jgi:hypothetical protein